MRTHTTTKTLFFSLHRHLGNYDQLHPHNCTASTWILDLQNSYSLLFTSILRTSLPSSSTSLPVPCFLRLFLMSQESCSRKRLQSSSLIVQVLSAFVSSKSKVSVRRKAKKRKANYPRKSSVVRQRVSMDESYERLGPAGFRRLYRMHYDAPTCARRKERKLRLAGHT